MVRCFAPGPGSWRGRPIAIAEEGSCELSIEALDEMRAHGFREWNGGETPAVVPHAVGTSTTDDVEGMSRSNLLKALKGFAKGNLMVVSTNELKRLVRERRGAESNASK
jgi:hypothetical protein